MKTFKHILFLVNPISGTGWQKKLLPFLQSQNLPFSFQLFYTQYAGHISSLLPEKLQAQPETDCVVVVGGDGTVHEMIQKIPQTLPLYILPCGSGNGVARHLGIRKQFSAMLHALANPKLLKADVWQCNGKDFIGFAGFGFDAQIAQLFNQNNAQRGFWHYVKWCAKAFFSYKPIAMRWQTENAEGEGKYFTLTLANINQFGNNAYIAPLAKIDDDYLDLCALRAFPLWAMPSITWKLFNKKLHTSAYYSHIICKTFTMHTENLALNLDGEALTAQSVVKIQKSKTITLISQI